MKNRVLTLMFSLGIIITGCASINGPTDPQDPFERYNRAVYTFNRNFDDAIATPVAKTYQNITPIWVDKGLTNFFSNLDDAIVIVNDLLQFKLTQAASDTARIFFNTTIGLFGFIDVATHLELPKHNEDFGQTLGYWGVPAGPYFVLPFLESSSIRDSVGLVADYTQLDPMINEIDSAATRNSLYVVKYIDTRADLLAASRLLDTAAIDPYVFTRDAYLQRRRYYVYDGNPPDEELEFEDAK